MTKRTRAPKKVFAAYMTVDVIQDLYKHCDANGLVISRFVEKAIRERLGHETPGVSSILEGQVSTGITKKRPVSRRTDSENS